jgi:hypothetical protein
MQTAIHYMLDRDFIEEEAIRTGTAPAQNQTLHIPFESLSPDERRLVLGIGALSADGTYVKCHLKEKSQFVGSTLLRVNGYLTIGQALVHLRDMKNKGVYAI